MNAANEAVAAMGGSYEFAKTASANLREKDDSWNNAIGGFFAGTMLGLRCKSNLIYSIDIAQANFNQSAPFQRSSVTDPLLRWY
jgi:hypothetical protein